MTSIDIVKKIIPICIMMVFVVIAAIFILFPPIGKLECKIKGIPGDVVVDYEYTANYSWWFVNEITIKEKVSSEDNKNLDKYKKMFEDDYKNYKNISFINSNIEEVDTSLVGTFHVNYNNVNSKDYKEMKRVMKYKNIFVGKLKRIYKNNGATCHYK